MTSRRKRKAERRRRSERDEATGVDVRRRWAEASSGDRLKLRSAIKQAWPTDEAVAGHILDGLIDSTAAPDSTPENLRDIGNIVGKIFRREIRSLNRGLRKKQLADRMTTAGCGHSPAPATDPAPQSSIGPECSADAARGEATEPNHRTNTDKSLARCES